MKLHLIKSIGVLIVLFSLTSPVEATIIYDESSSGDISSSPTEPTFDFTVGENTILGSAELGEDLHYDYDNFMFVLPAGSQLNSIVYDFTNVSREGFIYNAHISYRIENSAVSSEFIQSNPIYIYGYFVDSPHPVFPFSGGLPIGEGVYKWNISSSGWSGTANETPDYISWDYRIDFQVSESAPVPEPTTMLLLGLGLLGIAGVRRKI